MSLLSEAQHPDEISEHSVKRPGISGALRLQFGPPDQGVGSESTISWPARILRMKKTTLARSESVDGFSGSTAEARRRESGRRVPEVHG